ncbi:hypothetical protein DQT32_03635 [Salmonella enterica subsp. enterica serovar Braenderup]|nr:hypothetical protein [Salmonella enterica subsp. enterica serovar Braenderup]
MIVLNNNEMNELKTNKTFQFKVEVQGYDVFELVEDGFYQGMYRVHGNRLYDVPELDDNDNVISIAKAGTYERKCVLPKFIKTCCPFTKGCDIVDVHDMNGISQLSVLANVQVQKENNKYYWNISLVLV